MPRRSFVRSLIPTNPVASNIVHTTTGPGGRHGGAGGGGHGRRAAIPATAPAALTTTPTAKPQPGWCPPTTAAAAAACGHRPAAPPRPCGRCGGGRGGRVGDFPHSERACGLGAGQVNMGVARVEAREAATGACTSSCSRRRRFRCFPCGGACAPGLAAAARGRGQRRRRGHPGKGKRRGEARSDSVSRSVGHAISIDRSDERTNATL